MKYSGQISKMKVELNNPITYHLPIGKHLINMNELLGENITLEFEGEIRCVACNNQIKKTFMQGYCYPCFISSPLTSECILKPELCKAHKGEARDMQWASEHCLQDQYIYLSLTSHLKVGVTRHTQIPTRWIDQGATQALAIMRVRSRLQSGTLEVMFKKHVADKTNWREMLKGDAIPLDMLAESKLLIEKCKAEIQEVEDRFGFFAITILNGIQPVLISYPVEIYPEKVTSFNFDKQPEIESELVGIKGQYLIFEDGVINLRRFSGYEIKLSH